MTNPPLTYELTIPVNTSWVGAHRFHKAQEFVEFESAVHRAVSGLMRCRIPKAGTSRHPMLHLKGPLSALRLATTWLVTEQWLTADQIEEPLDTLANHIHHNADESTPSFNLAWARQQQAESYVRSASNSIHECLLDDGEEATPQRVREATASYFCNTLTQADIEATAADLDIEAEELTRAIVHYVSDAELAGIPMHFAPKLSPLQSLVQAAHARGTTPASILLDD